MTEEEQFVNIDLNDDNVCSICKLGTDIETLSFCHVCFEMSIEGVAKSDLLHTSSLRGHKDCFEKYHQIANQDCSRSKLSKSPYEEVKTILSKKINWIVQYAQNKDLYSDSECSKPAQHKLYKFRHLNEKSLLPQHDSQVPRYSEKWLDTGAGGIATCAKGVLERNMSVLQNSNSTYCHSQLWPHPCKEQKPKANHNQPSGPNGRRRHQHYNKEELSSMSREELGRLNEHLLRQLQDVFEDLSCVLQEKDALSSELHVRHVAIEQLLKNCSKLPCLQVGRAGVKINTTINN
ncbi:protein EURL homolog [Hyla sarda]|uniref:protein EURL homolog n=1 Tax=Hyla sarda TaxID=327740 RepID=UPI0024C3F387|nr:protein EURL homolog [Hyla sarda]XP_056415401.1 protein EURL homolog [Hyla sarda]XP_056415402.1 protein EURL homolog [Hyla sarda]XP_056415403.1 protein EURL homolog [Hyla sarda]